MEMHNKCCRHQEAASERSSSGENRFAGETEPIRNRISDEGRFAGLYDGENSSTPMNDRFTGAELFSNNPIVSNG
ncbi:hypothetical protein [Trichococcus patagoniensis]|uniref:hypothetical protein n=1 Tax=Trichococcus patagoniensis TaxID=382641 RepID=UPI0011B27D9E|nr:hypothetical protein [Trichococcus patagoniensis]